MNSNSKNLSIASLVCGIVSVVFSFFPYLCFLAIPAAIIAIVAGIKAQQLLNLEGAPTGMAVAGLVLGIVGAVLAVITSICYGIALCAACEYNNRLNSLYDLYYNVKAYI